MVLSPGDSFGTYTILATLGAGGMGEVYRARDLRLGREVALKVLTEEGAGSDERLQRFETEARAASSLNHPHIVVVYEVGDAPDPRDGHAVRFLAMELLDGGTLSEIIPQGGLPLRRFFELAIALADGLARAHEAGIVHRDLKPSNLIVTADGHLKILDFGLAKLRHQTGDGSPDSATLTITSPGELVGTLGYMSPEQARGEAAGVASDQFAVGCVLYEMLTGRRAFARASAADTISAILRDEPVSLTVMRPEIPPPLVWIVERCLAKDKRERYAATRDLARDLQNLRAHAGDPSLRSSGSGEEQRAPARRRNRLVGTALLALAALAAVLWFGWPRRPPMPEFRRLTFRHGVVSRGLFTPGADSFLYTASWDGGPRRTYLALPDAMGLDRPLESGEQLPMAYSDDGSQVLVLVGASRAGINLLGTLAAWPALGGTPRMILNDAGWADWSQGGRVLVAVRDLGAERVLERRDVSAAQAEKVIFRTPGAMSFVRLSPDGKRVAFIHHPSRFDDAGEVRIVDLDGSASRALTPAYERCFGLDWNARSGEIWLTASVSGAYSSTLFAVSPGGRLRPLHRFPGFFVLQSLSSDGKKCLLLEDENRRALLFQRAAEPARELSSLGFSIVTDLSPDGKKILFYEGGATPRATGIWSRDVDGGEPMRWGEGFPGTFSPDGRWIAGTTVGRPPLQLLLIPAGAGSPKALTSSTASHWAPSFAGPSTLLFVRSEGSQKQIWTMNTDGSGAHGLGAVDCNNPRANPAGTEFVCLGGAPGSTPFIHPIGKGEGRRLLGVGEATVFIYARFNERGDRILAVSRDRHVWTLDARTGVKLADDVLPNLDPSTGTGLLSVALNGDGTVRAFSEGRSSSGLHLAWGLD